MSWSPWMGRSARTQVLTTFLVAFWAIIGFANGKAQNIVSRPPSFQAAGERSFENQILDRLTETGQHQPDDLPNLARLVVLESIAMLVDIRTDLADTTIGNRLETEITGLSEASELFYESVSSTPLDLAKFARSRRLYSIVEVNYRNVESALGEFPGFSNQAAAHLPRLTRLIAMMGSLMGELESNLPATIPVPLERSIERESFQRQTRLLAHDLLELIVKASQPGEKRSGHQGALRDLKDLLDHVQSFEHTLSLQPSNIDIAASLHALRRRFWRVEATIIQLDWPAELRSGWRTVRGRMNAISDDLGMPRVMILVTTAQPVAQPASVTLERPIARVYRGSPGVRSETASK
jgi:hypothetical protein